MQADARADQTGQAPMTLARRLAWLAACLALGLVVGLVGFELTAAAGWFLAIPAVLAVGWFAIADPTQCLPVRERGAGDGPASEKL